MKKKILCLAMTVLMVVGASMTAQAEDFYGSTDWNVTFTGEKMESNFTSADITEEILAIQPGDSISLQVNLKNASKNDTDWYMTNEVLESLEDSVEVAQYGAYTYKLSYTDVAGAETVIYDSEVVGGEEDLVPEGEGLHQATNSLEDYFYLDTLGVGETGVVYLYVQLDGETQGNDYQKTLAQLQMNFAVEIVNNGTIIKTVQTGDAAPIMIFSAIALCSGLVVLFLVMKQMKDRREQKGV